MSPEAIWVTIIGISLATMGPRILPVVLFSRWEFPEPVIRWLSYIAPAVLGALTAASVLAPDGHLNLSWSNLFIWAFIPTLAVAIKTRSLFSTLIIGIITMALLYNFAGF